VHERERAVASAAAAAAASAAAAVSCARRGKERAGAQGAVYPPRARARVDVKEEEGGDRRHRRCRRQFLFRVRIVATRRKRKESRLCVERAWFSQPCHHLLSPPKKKTLLHFPPLEMSYNGNDLATQTPVVQRSGQRMPGDVPGEEVN